MDQSPFIDDPRETVRRHVADAVASAMPEAAALHIGLAEHHASIAKASGLPLNPQERFREPC